MPLYNRFIDETQLWSGFFCNANKLWSFDVCAIFVSPARVIEICALDSYACDRMRRDLAISVYWLEQSEGVGSGGSVGCSGSVGSGGNVGGSGRDGTWKKTFH